MPLVADIKLGWTKSPSAGLTRREIVIIKNGETTKLDVPVEVSEYMIVVPANTSVTFLTNVFDEDNKPISSESYSFVVGDGIDPLPDTDLFHENLGFREEGAPLPLASRK